MRRWLSLLALLAATPAAAQDAPAWVGVWEGKVGTFPVRLCIDGSGDGPARGAYYYLSQLEPISLSEEDGEGGWIEHGSSDPDALWAFAEQTGTRLRGTWRRGSRSLPFDLTPVAWTEGEWGGSCSSAAFLEPRLGRGRVVSEPAELAGWRYTRQSYQPAAHFIDEVAVETFTFTPERPGDHVIATWLASHLPHGTMADDFIECIGGAISSVGADGFFNQTLTPTLVSRDFVAVEESSGTFCGGAHPNYYTVTHTFDRLTGRELDLFDWIGEARIDGEDSTLAEPLRALVVARWPADAEEDCRELAEDTEYWSLGLARDGLVFRPDFPHVATACEEPVTVEWSALAPFLDKEGEEGLARLREE